MTSIPPVLQYPHHQHGRNPHALVIVKRSIKRVLRQFFLQSWTRYRGHLIETVDRLIAFFPVPDINQVKGQISAKRHWWFERDPHFHLRRQDGVVHLRRPLAMPEPRRAPCTMPCLKLVSYNCQSLGRGSSRLQELCEDLGSQDITVAALQGTRWRSAAPRSEWPVRAFSAGSTYTCFSWGRTQANRMLGVALLVRICLLQRCHVHTRFDPPAGLHGRLGGIRLVSRQAGAELDELFLCTYAPQESEDVHIRHGFFQAILDILHSVPRRTRIWLLGDFNGHIGEDVSSVAVGKLCERTTNHNGYSLLQACETLGLVLANTFVGGGPTC